MLEAIFQIEECGLRKEKRGSKKLTLDKFLGELYIYLKMYNLFAGG